MKIYFNISNTIICLIKKKRLNSKLIKKKFNLKAERRLTKKSVIKI